MPHLGSGKEDHAVERGGQASDLPRVALHRVHRDDGIRVKHPPVYRPIVRGGDQVAGAGAVAKAHDSALMHLGKPDYLLA